VSVEAGPGPALHRVPPEGLHLQRDPHGLREAARLPAQRGAHLHLPRGPPVRLHCLPHQHHRVCDVCLTCIKEPLRISWGDPVNPMSSYYHDTYTSVFPGDVMMSHEANLLV